LETRTLFTRTIGVLALLACLAVPSFACALSDTLPCYDYSVTSTISSLTIYGSTHGLGTASLRPLIKYSDGSFATPGGYGISVDSITYDVSFTFSPSLTSGAQIYLFGALTSSNSTASTDFQASYGTYTMTICSACSASAPATRTNSGATYRMYEPVTFTFTTTPSSSETIRAYILNSQIHFSGGKNYTPIGTCSSGMCVVDGNMDGYPAGAIPLYSVSVSFWGFDSSTSSDDRLSTFQ